MTKTQPKDLFDYERPQATVVQYRPRREPTKPRQVTRITQVMSGEDTQPGRRGPRHDTIPFGEAYVTAEHPKPVEVTVGDFVKMLGIATNYAVRHQYGKLWTCSNGHGYSHATLDEEEAGAWCLGRAL